LRKATERNAIVADASTASIRKERRVIGVLGSGTEEHAELAVPLGKWIAGRGFDLITGGGGGVMAAVCRGFHCVPQRRGVTIGILPAGPTRGYPNPWVDIPIHTHLPQRGAEGAGERSRNHLIVLSAQVLIALPGGPGTRTEIELADKYKRSLLAFLGASGAIEGLTRAALPAVAVTLAEVEAFVEKWCRLR
jgi:uncharacterized protein (TIGR00725 family)